MNKFVMFIWAFLMALIFGIIAMIGLNDKNKAVDPEYNEYITNIESISQKYLLKKNINLKYNAPEIIFYSDLVKEKFIKEDNNKYCIKSIIVTKGLFKNEYTISKNCELVNETE